MRPVLPHPRALQLAPTHDLRPGIEAMPPETRRAVRMVGTALAFGSLLLACAAAAQTAAYGPNVGDGGVLPWVFALFAGVAVVAVFLVVLNLVRTPRRPDGRLPDGRLPGTARDRH